MNLNRSVPELKEEDLVDETQYRKKTEITELRKDEDLEVAYTNVVTSEEGRIPTSSLIAPKDEKPSDRLGGVKYATDEEVEEMTKRTREFYEKNPPEDLPVYFAGE